MAFPRAYHTLTLLPDGKVIVTGGTQTTEHVDTAQAVLEAEMWNVGTETWSTMASRQIPRSYHGTALLLPDGRVLVSGSGQGGSPNQFNAELFSPPYLFKGPRPSITSSPQMHAHRVSGVQADSSSRPNRKRPRPETIQTTTRRPLCRSPTGAPRPRVSQRLAAGAW